MRILITGASGFIGRHCLPGILRNFDSVHCVSRSISKNDCPSALWYECDLLNPAEVKELIYHIKPTHLLHLAWTTAPGNFWHDPDNRTWLAASKELIRFFSECGGRRLVIAGTCAEYEWNESFLMESAVPHPLSLYGECKNELRVFCENFASRKSLAMAWARMFFIFGPYENGSKLVPSTIISLLREESARTASGELRRDYLYVKDAASALTRIMLSDFDGTVNVCSGRALSIREIVSEIAQVVGRSDLLEIGALPARPGDPGIVCGSSRVLNDEIEFSPKYSFREAIAETVEWWRNNLEDQLIYEDDRRN